MIKEIREYLDEYLKYTILESYEFKTLYGFTFVFKTTTRTMKGEISSSEISPVGIIYSENDEIYFAPLTKKYDLVIITEEYCKTI